MKELVYIESSVISYLAARPSRDIIFICPIICTPEELGGYFDV